VADDVAKNRASPRRKARGGQALYSDLAIEICISLRVVFRFPLRQTQGFMRSISKLMGLDLAVLDFSNLSRRGKGLKDALNHLLFGGDPTVRMLGYGKEQLWKQIFT
jgi:hypothetical protein